MVSNMGFNLLAIPFSYVGLAIASAMSATLNAYLLYRGLAKADVYHFSRKSAVFLSKFYWRQSQWVRQFGITCLKSTNGQNGFLYACLLACLVDCLSRNSLWCNVDFIRRSQAPFADKN